MMTWTDEANAVQRFATARCGLQTKDCLHLSGSADWSGPRVVPRVTPAESQPGGSTAMLRSAEKGYWHRRQL